MAGKLTVTATFDSLSLDAIKEKIRSVNADKFCLPLAADLLKSPTNGVYEAAVTINTDDSATQVAASGTVALVQASLTAGDVVYVGSVGFVATNGAVTLGHATFDMRTGNTQAGASLAAQINAHATLSGVVTATAATGTVTVTAVTKGTLSNHICLGKKATTAAGVILNGGADTVTVASLTSGAATDSSTITLALG